MQPQVQQQGYNNNQQQNYNQQQGYRVYQQPTPPKSEGHDLALAALICGIVSFFLDPLYLTSIAAIVCGIIVLVNYKACDKRTWAIAGIACGASSLVLQIIFDIVLTVASCGLGSVSLCF